MTDECYCRFLYDSEPYSIASVKGAKDNGSRGRLALEDILHDRLAHRLRTRTGCRDVVDQQTAEPQHIESDFDRAEGCG